jgi:hypothetical protein
MIGKEIFHVCAMPDQSVKLSANNQGGLGIKSSPGQSLLPGVVTPYALVDRARAIVTQRRRG